MEMNTRLQVEHPVTEAITGLDLVEWQLRVAAGGMLPLSQEAIARRGHAVEARLYAEDADAGFLPQAGRIATLTFPDGAGLRVDSGVRAGDEVSIFYDPMIAKLVAHGSTREQAIARLVDALDRTEVTGLTTNRDYLARALAHPAFGNGTVDTGFLARHAADLAPAVRTPRDLRLAALALALQPPIPGPFADAGGFRLNAPRRRYVDLYDRGTLHALTLTAVHGGWHLEGAGDPVEAAARWRAPDVLAATLAGEPADARIVLAAETIELRAHGRTVRLDLVPPAADVAAAGGDGRVLAPMPGRVLALHVRPGDTVQVGDRVAVLEAMKMEHRLTAPVAGTVASLGAADGDQVAAGQLIVAIEAGA